MMHRNSFEEAHMIGGSSIQPPRTPYQSIKGKFETIKH